MAAEKNQRLTYGARTPTVLVLPVARPDAEDDATYPRSSAIAKIFSRVFGDTRGNPRMARDTVAVETPATVATSLALTAMSPLIPVKTTPVSYTHLRAH